MVQDHHYIREYDKIKPLACLVGGSWFLVISNCGKILCDEQIHVKKENQSLVIRFLRGPL
jgi:hypothetical protein